MSRHIKKGNDVSLCSYLFIFMVSYYYALRQKKNRFSVFNTLMPRFLYKSKSIQPKYISMYELFCLFSIEQRKSIKHKYYDVK